MIYFTAHTFKCVCHCRRAMFRVLGMYNFAFTLNIDLKKGVYCVGGKNFQKNHESRSRPNLD